MSWFRNIKLVKEIKDKKVIYKLTADIEDVTDGISRWDIERLVKNELVSELTRDIRHRYIEDLTKSIGFDDIKQQALTAFKDDIRERFTTSKDR